MTGVSTIKKSEIGAAVGIDDQIKDLLPAYTWNRDSATKYGGGLGTAGYNITYAFDQPSHAALKMTAREQSMVREMMNAWEHVAQISFTEVSASASHNLHIEYATKLVNTMSLAEANFPVDELQRSLRVNAKSPLVFHPSVDNELTFKDTIVHELGHSLGLVHGHDTLLNGDQASVAAQYSIMSYNGQLTSPAPMINDIKAIQFLYGANFEYETGNNIYYFQSNMAQSIWDAGGIDTIDASTEQGGVMIDLRPGKFSRKLDDLGSVISNSYAVIKNSKAVNLIERAKGGVGNDLFIGNDATNVFTGGGGRNVFDIRSSSLTARQIDHIKDFEATDKIYLETTLFQGLQPNNQHQLSSAQFVIGSSAMDADDRVVFDSRTGALFYDADGIGQKQQILLAYVSGRGMSKLNVQSFVVDHLNAAPIGLQAVFKNGQLGHVGTLYDISIKNDSEQLAAYIGSIPVTIKPGTFVATLKATDTDANDTFTYQLVHTEDGLGDNSRQFEIRGNQLFVAANATFDLKIDKLMQIQILVTDSYGGTCDVTLNIPVVANENVKIEGQIKPETTPGNQNNTGIPNVLPPPTATVAPIATPMPTAISTTMPVQTQAPTPTAVPIATSTPLPTNQPVAKGGVFNGGASHDRLVGGVGDDTINGFAGQDTLIGGLGNDMLYGAGDRDTFLIQRGDQADVIYAQRSDGDVLSFGAGVARSDVRVQVEHTEGKAAHLVLNVAGGNGQELNHITLVNQLVDQNTSLANSHSGVAEINFADQNVWKMFIGTGQSERLQSDWGDGFYFGGQGDDGIVGGDGNDTVYGGEGDDTLNDLYEGDDVYFGNSGDDFIYTQVGNDTLSGGEGSDRLQGGGGADRFVFDASIVAAQNLDTILDFSTTDQDQFWLSQSVFNKCQTGVLSTSSFKMVSGGLTSGADQDDYVICNRDTGGLYYDADGAGGVQSVQFALLKGGDWQGVDSSYFRIV